MTELVLAPPAPEVVDVAVELSNRDLELIRRQVQVPRNARPPADRELEDFARYCMAQRLNPFDRQIYLAHIGGRWQPFTGVHGRLVIALRTREVDGMEGPYYCHRREGVERGQPPDWDELWDEDGPPHAAKFVVYRKGWTHHPVGIAPWRYYAYQLDRDGEARARTGTWLSNPALMLGYKAITRALNLVFPDVMPPAPDREPDLDESIGYIRDEDQAEPEPESPARPPAKVTKVTKAARGEMVDARPIAADLGVTEPALLLALRSVADELDRPLPTKLTAVSVELVDVVRERTEGGGWPW